MGGFWFFVEIASLLGTWWDLFYALSIVPDIVWTTIPRVLKIIDTARILLQFEEMGFMISCVVRTLPTLCWSMLLIAGFLMLPSIMIVKSMANCLADSPTCAPVAAVAESFGSVQLAALTIFKELMGAGFFAEYSQLLSLRSWVTASFFLFTI